MSIPSSPHYNLKLGKKDKELVTQALPIENSDEGQDGELRLRVKSRSIISDSSSIEDPNNPNHSFQGGRPNNNANFNSPPGLNDSTDPNEPKKTYSFDSSPSNPLKKRKSTRVKHRHKRSASNLGEDSDPHNQIDDYKSDEQMDDIPNSDNENTKAKSKIIKKSKLKKMEGEASDKSDKHDKHEKSKSKKKRREKKKVKEYSDDVGKDSSSESSRSSNESNESNNETKHRSKARKKGRKASSDESFDENDKNKHRSKRKQKKNTKIKKEFDIVSTYVPVDDEDIVNLPDRQKSNDNQEIIMENAQKPGGIGKANVVSKFHGWKGDDEAYYVYVEDGLKGRFKKMQYSQFLKLQKEREEATRQKTAVDTTIHLDNVAQMKIDYRNLYFQLAANVLNIFAFCRGLLAGVCLLHLTLTYFSNYGSFVSHFLQWYSPISSLVLKIYMILSQICFASAIYELIFKISKPPSVENVRISPPLIIALILQLILYLIVFYLTLVVSCFDDYFQEEYNKNNSWFQNQAFLESGAFLGRFIPWHVLNGVRTILCMLGYIVSFIAYRQRSSEIQSQMLRQHDLRN